MCIRFSASIRKSPGLSTVRADGRRVGEPSRQQAPAGPAGGCGYLHVENQCPFDFSRLKIFAAGFELVVYTLHRHTYH